jgi:glutaredoxin-like YruB-family protein
MRKMILLMTLLIVSSVTMAEVYKWVDESGRVHYGDNPDKSAQTTVVSSTITSYDSTPVNSDRAVKPTAPKQQKVTMYSTAWCGYCKKARKYFVAKGIPFVEYDIEKNAHAKRAYDKLGGKGVPVIVVGKKKMSGFSQQSFDRFYGS